MRGIYDLCYLTAFAVCSPWLWFKLRRRGPWREGFGQRFGRYSGTDLRARRTGCARLWLHAVSVGEVNTCLQLAAAIGRRFPAAELVISTTTNTGMAELHRKLPPPAHPIYFPFDFSPWVRRALTVVQPDAVVLLEREIWPNFLWEAARRNLPVLLVNARMTERSLRWARSASFLFRELYRGFHTVGAQSPEDARRLEAAGCLRGTLHVTGSLKFDTAPRQAPAEPDAGALLRQCGWKSGAPVIVAGSTHEGEELLLARVCERLRTGFPGLFLVLVPRHFERCAALSALLHSKGFEHRRRSELNTASGPTATPCLLVDTTGELVSFYAQADVVFVGKSLCARGGQNPIEPAALGKAIVFGPHMQNFPDAARLLMESQAAVMVSGEAELETTLHDLLREPDKRSSLGQRAMNVVRTNSGATERTLVLIAETLRWPLE